MQEFQYQLQYKSRAKWVPTAIGSLSINIEYSDPVSACFKVSGVS